MSEIRLSDRVRPDSEAAPWVVQEIKKLESENDSLRKALKVCLSHWLLDDNPDELQSKVLWLKELCFGAAELQKEEKT